MNQVRTFRIGLFNPSRQYANRSRISFSPASAAIGLIAAVLGCVPSPPQTDSQAAALDPRPTHLDFVLDLGPVEETHQWLLFDGRLSPLRKGNGWSNSRYSGGVRGWGHHAWARRRATLHFRADGQRDLVLVFRTHAYGEPGLPEQGVQVFLNNHPLERCKIPRRWVEFTVRLPRQVIEPGLNTIDFRFDWDVNPHLKNPSAEDRFMSAVFTAVGVLPPEEAFQEKPVPGAGFIPGTARLVLSPGGSAWLAMVESVELEIRPSAFADGELEVVVAKAQEGETRTKRCNAPCPDGLSIVARGGDEVTISLSRETHEPATLRLKGVALSTDSDDRRFASRAPDILVYLVDTLRADTSFFGGREERPPGQISRFVDTATVFERARTPAPWTLPATWSLLTGRYPTAHGFRKAALRPADLEGLTTLGERLSSVGYRTIAASQSYIIGRTYGFDRGFDYFSLCDRLGATDPRPEDARWIAWHRLRDTPRDTPAFLYIHTVEPHAPYSPPEADRILENVPENFRENVRAPTSLLSDRSSVTLQLIDASRQLYSAEARRADLAFGETLRLMAALDRLENTLVVFTSDHGEEFYEHGAFDHSRTLFDELLLVPLAVWFPGGELQGTRTDIPVSLIDVVPTVMAAAGLPPDPTLPGEDLRSIVAGHDATMRILAAETDPESQAEVWAEVSLRCAVMEDLKCIVSDGATDRFGEPVPKLRLFDLARDPGETKPLDGPRISDVITGACMDSLSRLMPRDELHGDVPMSAPVSEEVRAQLRALGYLGD